MHFIYTFYSDDIKHIDYIKLDNNLPNSLTHLVAGCNFNQNVSGLTNLTHMTVGNNFNQDVSALIKLVELTTGDNFNKEKMDKINIKTQCIIVYHTDSDNNNIISSEHRIQ